MPDTRILYLFQNKDGSTPYLMKDDLTTDKLDKISIIANSVRLSESDERDKVLNAVLSKVCISNPDDLSVPYMMKSLYIDLGEELYQENKAALDVRLNGNNEWTVIKMSDKGKVTHLMTYDEYLNRKLPSKRSDESKRKRATMEEEAESEESGEVSDEESRAIKLKKQAKPKTSKPLESGSSPDIDLDLVDVDGILSIITELPPALNYSGFDPIRIRSRFVSKNPDSMIVAKNLSSLRSFKQSS
jgi:hypothetical protein